MHLINKLYDNRIQAYNLLFEISIKEYLDMSVSIIEKNEFQRRRVKSSSTIYSLLKKDLLVGCIIPPIVLALSSDQDIGSISELGEEGNIAYIKEHSDKLIILDGLQRTLTIRDLYRDLNDSGDLSSIEKLDRQKLRIEIYVGINKVGILYRMLTLNTGQTPMSMRHQIEILYSDYLEKDLDGLSLIMESDNRSINNLNEYKFKDIVEGFNSYLDRDYLPIDRNTILENIESLDKLSAENQNNNLFLDYLKAFDGLIKALISKSNGWNFDENESSIDISNPPFGKNPETLFKKSQLMTGFGSAVGKLVDHGVIDGFNELLDLYDKIELDNIDDSLDNYVKKLDLIKIKARKIGNDQRMFFHHFFREIFDKKGDSYLNFNDSVEEAYSTYLRKTQ